MNLLALDFSSEQRAVGVSLDSGVATVTTTTDRRDGPMGLIDSALRQAGLNRKDIDTIAVGLGPGSYTGIRSAIAIAQGFQLGRQVDLCGISSAEVVAHSTKLNGEFAVVINAQRGEFYCATYRRSNAGVETTSQLRICTSDELAKLDLPLIGPEVERIAGQGENVNPDPTELARLARTNATFTAGHKLEPIYLRTPEFKKAPPPRQID